MATTEPSPGAAPDPNPGLSEHCAALALRLCPMAAAYLIWRPAAGPATVLGASHRPGAPALPPPPAAWHELPGDQPLTVVADLTAHTELGNLAGEVAALLRLSIPRPAEDSLTLWLLDRAPREPSAGERAALIELAPLIGAALAGHHPPEPARQPIEAILHNASDLVAIVDAGGIMRYVSPSVTRLLGHQPADMVGHDGFDFVHPDDLRRTLEQFQAIVGVPGTHQLDPYRLRTAAGDWRSLEVTLSNRLDDPQIRGVIINARDVTDRVAIERAQRLTEARFLAIFENAPLGIVAVATDGTIVLANRALAELFGYSQAGLVGQPLELLLPEGHRSAHRGQRKGYMAAPTPRPMGLDRNLVGRHRSGAEIPIEVSLSAVEYEGDMLAVAFVVDIRDRLRAEVALRESEERYRRLVELSPDMVTVIQQEQIVFVNHAGARLLAAQSPEQLIGRTLSELVHPDERDSSEVRVRATLSGGELPPVERRMVGLDGRVRVVELAPAGITYAGAPAVMAIARDISERRRAEQHVRFQASVLDQMSDAVVVVDNERRILYLNPTAEQQYGRRLEEARGAPLGLLFRVEYFQPGDAEAALAAMQAEGVWRGECRHRLGDGRSLVVEVAVVALRGETGGMVAVIRDVTARRAAEERLRLLESVVIQAHDAVTITEGQQIDEPGPRILYVNDAFSRMTGYPAEEVIGRSPRFMQGHETDPQALAEIRAALVERRPTRVELCNYTRAGQPLWIDLSIAPVFGAGGEVSHFIAIQRDITERKQLEAKLLQSQKLESIGRLAGGIAHDFNNLLTVIGGYTDLALESVDQSQVRADIEEIRKAVERAAALTGQLLAFARRQPHSPRSLQLNSVVGQIEKLLQRLLGPDIALRTALAEGPTPVVADPNQIEQVLINLAVNARDAMPRGGTLTISTALVADAEAGELVRLTVADSGSGMSEEVLSHAFEPFFTTKGPGQGTGLGLATCYGIVRQHDGRISIDSAPGRGTSIVVELPARAEQAAQSGPGRAAAGGRPGTETVLVVDDDPAVRLLAGRVLREAGYTVIEAVNGREAVAALEAAAGAAVQLVITDVLMPEMNGRQLGEWVSVRRPGVRLLFMSGHAFPDGEPDEAPALAPLLAKPFSMGALLQAARAALED